VAQRAQWAPVDLARAYLDGGARLIQIRAKHLPSGPLLDLCNSIAAVAVSSKAVVIVNDRADLARMAGAAGVHVGQDDVPPAQVRQLLGPGAVIGLSTHTMTQVEEALLEPVDYIAVGPVFGTRTKDTGYDAVGLDFVSAAARLAGAVPIVAIGGMTLQNAASVIGAGAASVAVIGDLLATSDPRGRTRAYVQALARHRV
jgi:thiamine-phosphate pyrophosphorylase